MRVRIWRPASLIAASVWLLLSPVTPALAEHTVITEAEHDARPYGSFNGIRVYLSSPTHTNSGSRGECRANGQGWEENINGRFWNFYSTISNYYGEQKKPDDQYRNFRSRGYWTKVSENSRNGRYLNHRSDANRWGAKVYIVTHTNAAGSGCPHSANYLLVMHRKNNEKSSTFADLLRSKLDPVTPGGFNRWDDYQQFPNGGLPEINGDNRAAYKAYVELFFHTRQASQTWNCCDGMTGSAQKYTWRYGWAVDHLLGYP